MQLAYDTLLKLNSVSKMEMNFFLQCVRYQDEHRRVIGVYYKEFMQVLGMKSKQTFYNVLRSLSEKMSKGISIFISKIEHFHSKRHQIT